jgi:hypothetical protein
MDSVTRHPVRLGRLAGATALVYFAVFFWSIGPGPSDVLHSNITSQSVIAYAAQHGRDIMLQGWNDGLNNTLFGILIVLLIAIAGADGILSRIAYVCAGAAVAIQWTHASILYGLADLAHRGGADQGVMALFTLGSTMDEADAIVAPVAAACAGWLLLRSHRVPALVAWLTLAVAALDGVLVVLTVAGGPDLGPVTVISGWVWLIGIGITLLIRPVSRHERTGVVVPARATAS